MPEDYGVFGNGHGLIYEKNSDATLAPVLTWLPDACRPDAFPTKGSHA